MTDIETWRRECNTHEALRKQQFRFSRHSRRFVHVAGPPKEHNPSKNGDVLCGMCTFSAKAGWRTVGWHDEWPIHLTLCPKCVAILEENLRTSQAAAQ